MSLLLVGFVIGCTTAPPPAPVPPPEVAPAPQVAAHLSHSDHMMAMAATRDRLRAELGANYDQPVAGLDAADPARGKALFDDKCASCHGATGKGDGPAAAALNPPPADFTDAFHARYYADAARVLIIANGIQDTAMVGVGGELDASQILDVYAYVRSFREAPAPK